MRDDGGPAFPETTYYDDKPIGSNGGMSLRDYFAAKAMQSIFGGEAARLVIERDQRFTGDNFAEVIASNAYEMADAMLRERAK